MSDFVKKDLAYWLDRFNRMTPEEKIEFERSLNRKEWYALACGIVFAVLLFAAGALAVSDRPGNWLGLVPFGLVSAALFLPLIAAACRRVAGLVMGTSCESMSGQNEDPET